MGSPLIKISETAVISAEKITFNCNNVLLGIYWIYWQIRQQENLNFKFKMYHWFLSYSWILFELVFIEIHELVKYHILINCSLHLPWISVFKTCHGHTSGQPIAPIFLILFSSSSSSNWRIRWGNMYVYIHTYNIKSRNEKSWKIKNCTSYNNDHNADAI